MSCSGQEGDSSLESRSGDERIPAVHATLRCKGARTRFSQNLVKPRNEPKIAQATETIQKINSKSFPVYPYQIVKIEIERRISGLIPAFFISQSRHLRK